MFEAVADIEGVSCYSQSRHHGTAQNDNEDLIAYRERTWREHLHYDKKTGEVFIPNMAMKNCLSEAAKFLSLKVKDGGKATYTKHFESGVMVVEPPCLGINKDDVGVEWHFLPSDGQRGGGRRVWKAFPVIQPGWTASVHFIVVDSKITREVFETHLSQAGNLIGIGRFRPRNNGFYGRFIVKKLKWTES